MTWLAWRQFRTQATLAVLALAVVLAVLVATRNHVAETARDLSTGYQSLRLLGTALIGLPAVIGAFWGAPLVARELEAGTHRLVWTQSVTRGRWLAVKLGVIALTAAAVTALFSLTFTWWSLPLDELGNRLGTANFSQRGVAPIAYALFALALGTLLGIVLRRTLPAMAATLVGFFVVRFAFQLVRPHLFTPSTFTQPTQLFGSPDGGPVNDGAWVLSTRTADSAGHFVSAQSIENRIAEACPLGADRTVDAVIGCAHRLGFQDVVRAHPGSHFWAFQSAEAAAFVAFTLILIGAAFWRLRRTA